MPSTNFTAPIEELMNRVRALTTPRRLAHIFRVADLAARIAAANAADPEKAYIAGLLHDSARDLSDAAILELVTPETEWESAHPRSLHGRAGRVLAQGFGIQDSDILEAIEGHVYGVDLANQVGMAVFVADTAEPGRGVNHGIRELALAGQLEAAYAEALRQKLAYLKGKGIAPHPRTVSAYAQISS